MRDHVLSRDRDFRLVQFYAFSRFPGARLGLGLVPVREHHVPVVGNSSLGDLKPFSVRAFGIACVLIVVLALAAPAP